VRRGPLSQCRWKIAELEVVARSQADKIAKLEVTCDNLKRKRIK
jgi:hypothetical protein